MSSVHEAILHLRVATGHVESAQHKLVPVMKDLEDAASALNAAMGDMSPAQLEGAFDRLHHLAQKCAEIQDQCTKAAANITAYTATLSS